MVELKALLSQLRSQLTEVAPCPGVNTRVEEEVRSALGHQLVVELQLALTSTWDMSCILPLQLSLVTRLTMCGEGTGSDVPLVEVNT